MAMEIERKFLLRHDGWRSQVSESGSIRQGYLALHDKSSVRVRVDGNNATINLKSATVWRQRLEVEYSIPEQDGNEILDCICLAPLTEKTRHRVPAENLLWEIDEFHGANEGLIVAEVELDDPGQVIEFPDWIGREVTEELRYYNMRLVSHPFSQWNPEQRK